MWTTIQFTDKIGLFREEEKKYTQNFFIWQLFSKPFGISLLQRKKNFLRRRRVVLTVWLHKNYLPSPGALHRNWRRDLGIRNQTFPSFLKKKLFIYWYIASVWSVQFVIYFVISKSAENSTTISETGGQNIINYCNWL